jgi:hypothetical protein
MNRYDNVRTEGQNSDPSFGDSGSEADLGGNADSTPDRSQDTAGVSDVYVPPTDAAYPDYGYWDAAWPDVGYWDAAYPDYGYWDAAWPDVGYWDAAYPDYGYWDAAWPDLGYWDAAYPDALPWDGSLPDTTIWDGGQPDMTFWDTGDTGSRTPIAGMCHRTRGDTCASDSDCITGGCGGELCHNPTFGAPITTCDCTQPVEPCGCVGGTCQWYY